MVEQNDVATGFDATFILPSRACVELLRAVKGAETVTLGVAANKAVVVLVGGTALAAPPLEGTFPAFRKILPDNLRWSSKIPRVILAETLARVALITDNKNPAVKVTFTKGNLSLFTRSDAGNSTGPG